MRMIGWSVKRDGAVRCSWKKSSANRRPFGRAENGNITVFALTLFVLMTMMGGFAIDLMKYEQTRTTLQNTLDRSTLAAAALTQERDPETVVRDYFHAAGISETLTRVEVTEGINFRQVVADAGADTNPYFMHMLGIDRFDAVGRSGAEQRITNVEIVLVLDVSGSMGSNNRLINLKSAAKEFVTTVLNSDVEQRISIALVPFNGQVNLGATLASKFNMIDNPNVSGVTCVDLPTTAYTTFGVSRTSELPMTANADTFSATSGSGGNSSTAPSNVSVVSPTSSSSALPNPGNRWCPPSAANIVRLPSYNATQLKGYIDSLDAIGATSINAGMKWGMTMIDPTARSMFAQLISAGAIANVYSGRPYEFADDDSMKIIVLMTDGDHFAQERVNGGHRSGNSNIWRSAGDGNYSSFFDRSGTTSDYWVPHRNEWRTTAWTSNATAAVRQTWPQVWTDMRLSYVAWHLYARGLFNTGTNSQRQNSYRDTIADFRSQIPTGTMNNQLQTACGQAKAQGVIVYGIAFEAPTDGAAQIAACASSSAHYFNASGLQINTAFRAIASNISQLRLTQ
jgi:Flp pilus assembly protein TadG